MQGLQSKRKGVADVVICVDCTGSMSPCIENVKSNLRTFLAELERPPDPNTPKVDWRLKFLGFRDLNCDSEPYVNLAAPLVTTVEEALAQLDKFRAEGGQDEPESVLDALWQAATQTSWRSGCTKVAVLFTDATPHERMHSSTVAAGAVGDDVNAVAQALAEKRVYLHAWGPQHPVWDTLKTVGGLNHTHADGGGLASVDFSKLFTDLAKTVSQTSIAAGAQ